MLAFYINVISNITNLLMKREIAAQLIHNYKYISIVKSLFAKDFILY